MKWLHPKYDATRKGKERNVDDLFVQGINI
jgi:hypothetical protein